MTLWSSEPTKPKSFLDIGCGNGLLVYLLTQEGFEGGVGVVSFGFISGPEILGPFTLTYLVLFIGYKNSQDRISEMDKLECYRLGCVRLV